MAVRLHIIAFSSLTPYILVGECHRFEGPYCLHVQGWKVPYKLAAIYIQAARITQTLLGLVRVRNVPVGSRFSSPLGPAPKSPPFCTVGTGSFSTGKSGRGVVLTTPHPSSADFANLWPIRLLHSVPAQVWHRVNFPSFTGEVTSHYFYLEDGGNIFLRRFQTFQQKTRSIAPEGNSIHSLIWTAFFERLKRLWSGGCGSGHSRIWVVR